MHFITPTLIHVHIKSIGDDDDFSNVTKTAIRKMKNNANEAMKNVAILAK